MPFKVDEETFRWECQAIPNDDSEFTDTVGSEQFFFILSVDMQSVQQIRKPRNVGSMRVLGSPAKVGDGDAEADATMSS